MHCPPFVACGQYIFLSSNYISRYTLLFMKHQNFTLQLKAITSGGGKISANRNTVAKLSNEEISSLVNKLVVDKVVFSAWKEIDVVL